jgi:hypothetical protein
MACLYVPRRIPGHGERETKLESTMVGFFIGVEEDAGESIDDIIGKLSMESNAASHI